MTQTELQEALSRHAFCHGLAEKHLAALAPITRQMSFAVGSYLTRDQEPAAVFYLIESGRVAIEVHAPGWGELRVQTIGPNEAVGWSWLRPPFRWQFDARAVEPVQTLAIDAPRLRALIAQDVELGFLLLERLVWVISDRLKATRLQLLDVYR